MTSCSASSSSTSGRRVVGLERFQLVDEAGQLLAIAHPQAGRTVYDRGFPELTRA